MRLFLALPLLLAAPARAAPRAAPSPARLKASVCALVAFGTRHTLSTTTDPRRGIRAARDVTGTTTTLVQVPVDDHFVGVFAPAADGSESPVTFAGRTPRR